MMAPGTRVLVKPYEDAVGSSEPWVGFYVEPEIRGLTSLVLREDTDEVTEVLDRIIEVAA